MMRWAICCAMSLTLSGWAGERTVTVPGKERWVAFSDLSPQGEDLTVKIVPKDCWELTGQDVTIELMDDELAWVREVHTGQEHRYKMVAGLGMSSREWIRVDGKVKYICGKKGGGTPPDFRVTVTAVDVDAQGLEQDTDEQTEETVGAFICMDTNAVLPPRKAVYVRPVEPSPQKGNQTLKWPSAVSLWTGDDLSATKLSGDSVSLSPTATTTYWMQGETPATDVYLELEHTNEDGQKATDKVKVTVLKVDIEQTNDVYCVHQTNATLNLTSDSFLGSGTANWTSVPAGISGTGSNITFNPSTLTPAQYVVTAKSSLLSTCEDTATVCVYRVTFDVESDATRGSSDLTDNRKTTATITVEGHPDPGTLSFAWDANPVETSNIINKAGTAVNFTSTTNPLVWRTSEVYWYGISPDQECNDDLYEYQFDLTVNGTCTISNRYEVGWPGEDPKMQPDLSSTSSTVIAAAEIDPGNTNRYRCRITWGNYTKTGIVTNLPVTDQYATETALEENRHLAQWLGTVGSDDGGQADLFTAQGLRFAAGFTNAAPDYVYAASSSAAQALAVTTVANAETAEETTSYNIWNTLDAGFVEYTAKDHAGYNAAWTYWCTYASHGDAVPTNTVHPAYLP